MRVSGELLHGEVCKCLAPEAQRGSADNTRTKAAPVLPWQRQRALRGGGAELLLGFAVTTLHGHATPRQPRAVASAAAGMQAAGRGCAVAPRVVERGVRAWRSVA